MNSQLPSGFFVLHSNSTERLLDLLLSLIERWPLAPLEDELFLVQNNAMKQWLQVKLSQKWGVCAGVQFISPSLFLQVLHRQSQLLQSEVVQVQDDQQLAWQILICVPQIPALHAHFAKIPNEVQKYQLALQLAKLFIEYQLYRPDWLANWLAGENILRQEQQSFALPDNQLWQPELWRILNAQSTESQKASWPGNMLANTLKFVSQPLAKTNLSKRICVFGGLRLAPPMLKLLQALSQFSQILLTVINPCQEDWVENWHLQHLELQATTEDSSPTSPSALPALLQSGAKPMRDYLLQLNQLELVEKNNLHRIDLFHPSGSSTDSSADLSAGASLLKQMQGRLLTLAPPTQATLLANDLSIQFVSCHSIYRELEVLHDHILSWLQQDETLQLQDIQIAIPKIADCLADIHAVFGRYAPTDARYIPYVIAQSQAKDALQAPLAKLLLINRSRMSVDEFFDLLAEDIFLDKYSLELEDLHFFKNALDATNARWGLDAQHRLEQGQTHSFAQNSLLYGINRLLLGQIVGELPSSCVSEANMAEGFAPFVIDLGIGFERLEILAEFWLVLKTWSQALRQNQSASDWRQTLSNLLESTFGLDQRALPKYLGSLDVWSKKCQFSGFDFKMTIDLVNETWLLPFIQSSASPNLSFGKLQLSEIGLMRGIPCKILCMLGMNAQVFPRQEHPLDFDLIARSARPRLGDRSRLEDDRELMLLALLSARQKWYLSWSGNNDIDNNSSLPSILVQRLQDEIETIWGRAALQQLMQVHPLQAFSQQYFDARTPYFTFSKEWQVLHTVLPAQPTPEVQEHPKPATPAPTPTPATTTLPLVLNLPKLYQFWRDPIQSYVQTVWHTQFTKPAKIYDPNESLEINGLDRFLLFDELFKAIQKQPDHKQSEQLVYTVLQNQKATGKFPVGTVGAYQVQKYQVELAVWCGHWQEFMQNQTCRSLETQSLDYIFENIKLVPAKPWLGLRLEQEGAWQLCWLNAQHFDEKKDSANAKLFPYWLEMLFFAATGYCHKGVVFFQNRRMTLPVLSQEAAQTTLHELLVLWRLGQNQMLAVPMQTAMQEAMLQEESQHEREQKVLDTYEGSGFLTGENQKLAGFGRFYEYLTDLKAEPLYHNGVEKVYLPFITWVNSVISHVIELPN